MTKDGYDVMISDDFFDSPASNNNKWVWDPNVGCTQEDVFVGVDPRDDSWISTGSVDYCGKIEIIVPTVFVRLQPYCGSGDVLNIIFIHLTQIKQGLFQRAVFFLHDRCTPWDEITFFIRIMGIIDGRVHLIPYNRGDTGAFSHHLDILHGMLPKTRITIEHNTYFFQTVSMIYHCVPIIQPPVLLHSRLDCSLGEEHYRAFVDRLGSDRYRLVFDNPSRSQEIFAHRQEYSHNLMPTIFMLTDHGLNRRTISSVLGYHPSMIQMIKIIHRAEEVHMMDSFPAIFQNLLMRIMPHEFDGFKYHIYSRFISGMWPLPDFYTTFFRPFRLVFPLHNRSRVYSTMLMDSLKQLHAGMNHKTASPSVDQLQSTSISQFELFIDQYVHAMDIPSCHIGIEIRRVLPAFYKFWSRLHALSSINIPMSKHPLLHPIFEPFRKPVQLIDMQQDDIATLRDSIMPNHDAIVLIRLQHPSNVIYEAHSRRCIQDPSPTLINIIDSVLEIAPYIFPYTFESQKTWFIKHFE